MGRLRALKIGDRFVEGRELNVADTQILVDGGIVCVHCERALEVVERLFAFAGQRERQAEIGENRGIARFLLKSLLKPRNRFNSKQALIGRNE